MGEWPTVPLVELSDIKTGKLDSNAAVEGGKYPYFTCSPETLGINEYAFDCNAVLLAGNNANGVFCVKNYSGKFNAYQRTYVITPKDEKQLNTSFLYYFLMTLSAHLTAFSSGTATKFLTKRILDPLPVPVPSSTYQKAIASLLGALDNKIDLNRQTNATLEAMARALFKDWFVDFGPTRAKAEGRAPYLAPHLWDLFPDALDDEDKPTGWLREPIGKHVSARKGLSYKGSGLTDETEGLPLHNLNSVLEGGGYKNEGLKFYSGDFKPNHLVKPGDLIVANTEQGFDHLLIGYSALVPSWAGDEGLFSHHIFKIEPRAASPLSRFWLHFALSASYFGEAIRRFSNGTTVNMLPADAFVIPSVIIPPSRVVSAFDNWIEPILQKQEEAVEESRTLAQTRDFLLPKLMSGEIRLREAEQIAEAVL